MGLQEIVTIVQKIHVDLTMIQVYARTGMIQAIVSSETAVSTCMIVVIIKMDGN